MWETDGIFCRHIIRVYSVRYVFAILDFQILKRWSRGIKGDYPRPNTNALRMLSIPNIQFMTNSIMQLYDIEGMTIGNHVTEKLMEDRVNDLRAKVISLSGNDAAQHRRKSKCVITSSKYWNFF